jgi:hypothetical protein
MVTLEKRVNALVQTVSPRLSPGQSFENYVITRFAIFAVYAFIQLKTAFINVDLDFPASSKNYSIRNFNINQCSQIPDSRDQSSATIHPKCDELH